MYVPLIYMNQMQEAIMILMLKVQQGLWAATSLINPNHRPLLTINT